MSRLATIGDGANTYAAYRYLGAGRIVTEDYEDTDVNLDYTANNFAALDRFGRILDQIWTDYGANPDVVLDHYSYTYDRAGNRTSRANELHSAFDEDYTYDRLDRLTAADRADNFDQSWGLDGLGNFSAFDDDDAVQMRTANAVNEITAITGGWITPGYDRAGNMISGPRPRSGTTRVHYVYDAWNRLVELRADDSGEPGDLIAEYQYDGTNRRIEKVVTETGGSPSDAHYYYNHGWQLLEERFLDSQEQLSASNHYLWSARYIDSPVMRFHDANGDGDCLDAGDNVRYYLGDANFNVTATLDAGTGGVVERYVYTAYGEATVYNGSWANPADPTTDGPLYCGYFFDAETGLYQVRNRYYDSSLSTFISRDPLGVEGGINLYEYVGNSPVYRTDPFGLKPLGQKWDVPDFFWWYYFGFGQDVPLDKIGLLQPWWAAIKPQVLLQLKLKMVPGLESQLSCEHEDSPSAEISIKPFTIPVAAGGANTDPLTVMGNSIVNVRGTCKVTLQCKQCCAGERVVSGSSGTCDLDFTVRDKFQNPLDKGGPFGKHDWPGATPYGLVASWSYTYTWKNTYDNPCPEDQWKSK